MKQWTIAALLALWVMSPAFSAQPGPDWGRRGGQDPRGGQNQRAGPQPQVPDQRRMEQAPQRREGALSDEERRGLHRDLDKANRELYRRR